MAIAAFSRIHRTLFSVRQSYGALTATQYRHVSHTTIRFDDSGDSETGTQQQPADGENELVEASESKPPPTPVNTKPYAEYLRQILTEKYLSNQPIAKPHRLNKKTSSKTQDLQDLRIEYRRRLSALRKEYAREVEEKKSAKATHDKKQREEILRAKEERLKLKKEKSAQRAIEVEAEKRVLQEQLAKERAERQAYRKQMDMKIETRRQKERDIIRQQSGTWIEEKDLEQRIAEALSNPIDL